MYSPNHGKRGEIELQLQPAPFLETNVKAVQREEYQEVESRDEHSIWTMFFI